MLQNVPVKVVMTESFRSQLTAQVRSSLDELDQQEERLREALQQAADPAFQDRLRNDLGLLTAQRQGLEWRIREAESVGEGAEIFLQTVPLVLHVKVGESFVDALATELLLQDGKLKEIRGGAAPAAS